MNHTGRVALIQALGGTWTDIGDWKWYGSFHTAAEADAVEAYFQEKLMQFTRDGNALTVQIQQPEAWVEAAEAGARLDGFGSLRDRINRGSDRAGCLGILFGGR